jgi:hypothetical protein
MTFVNRWNNPMGKEIMSKKCKHKVVLDNQRLICEHCGETIKT